MRRTTYRFYSFWLWSVVFVLWGGKGYSHAQAASVQEQAVQSQQENTLLDKILKQSMTVETAEKRLKATGSTYLSKQDDHYLRTYRSRLFPQGVVELVIKPEGVKTWVVEGWKLREETPEETFVSLAERKKKLDVRRILGMSQQEAEKTLELWKSFGMFISSGGATYYYGSARYPDKRVVITIGQRASKEKEYVLNFPKDLPPDKRLLPSDKRLAPKNVKIRIPAEDAVFQKDVVISVSIDPLPIKNSHHSSSGH